MRLDYEGRDAEIGLVFIRDTSEKPDSCKEGVGVGGGRLTIVINQAFPERDKFISGTLGLQDFRARDGLD